MGSVAASRAIETGLELLVLEVAEKQLVLKGMPEDYAMLVVANPGEVTSIPEDILYPVIAQHVPIESYEIVPHKSSFYIIPKECIAEGTDPKDLIPKLEVGKSVDLGFTTLHIAIGFKEVPEGPWESLDGLPDVPCYDGDIARWPKLGSTPFDIRRGVSVNAIMLTREEVADGQRPYM